MYESADVTDSHFDLSEISGYHYTEYSHFVYTNGDLIAAGLSNAGINTLITQKPKLPFNFRTEKTKAPIGSNTTSVVIHYSDTSSTEFSYNSADMKYTISKCGTEKKDLLNDKSVTFSNLFILFADSITYESKELSELVMNTAGGGEGYYVSCGTAIKILWSTNTSGELVFRTENGEILTANCGNSYIGIVKSSRSDDVKLS